MGSDMGDWGDDDGLPDAAFTELELEAGVQHIMRSGRADACLYKAPERVQHAPAQLDGNVLRFDTYAQAQVWAKANPGSVFTRAADGRGFEAKVAPIASAMAVNRHVSTIREKPRDLNQEIDYQIQCMQEMGVLSPHMHDILTKSGSTSRVCIVRPFSDATFIAELERLDHKGRARLRTLLYEGLQSSKELQLRIERDMSRDRSMKSGHYGEELRRRLIELRERVLVILDRHINKQDRGGRS